MNLKVASDFPVSQTWNVHNTQYGFGMRICRIKEYKNMNEAKK